MGELIGRLAHGLQANLADLLQRPLDWPGIAVAVTFGIALTFFGWAIYRFVSVACGFLVGLFLGYVAATLVGISLPELVALVAGVALALVAVWFRKVVAFAGGALVGLLIGGALAAALFPRYAVVQLVLTAAGFLFIGLAALYFTRGAVIFSSAVIGAAATILAAWKTLKLTKSTFLSQHPDFALAVALVLGLGLAIGGMWFQSRHGPGDE